MERATQLLTADPNGERTSRAIYWPGGEGELQVFGSLGTDGTLALYQAPIWTARDDLDEVASYQAHGATLSGSTKFNRFWAGEGFLYVGFGGAAGDDNFTAGIGYSGDKNQQAPYFVTEGSVA